MSTPENLSYPPLRVVRNPELLAIEDLNVRFIEAYCDELLVDGNGNPRDEATYEATPFRHSVNKWSHVRFRREGNGYNLTCFGDNTLDDVVYEVSMHPYNHAEGMPIAPYGAAWFIEYGSRESDKWDYSFEPSTFRECLEEIWGLLPQSVQEKLGIKQASHRDYT